MCFRKVQIGIELVHIHIELDRRIGKTFHVNFGLDLALQQATGEIRLHILLQGIHLHAALHSLLTDLFGSLSPVAVTATLRLFRLNCCVLILPDSGELSFTLKACSGCFTSRSRLSALTLNDCALPSTPGSDRLATILPKAASNLAFRVSLSPEYLSLVRLSDGASSVASNL